MKRGNIILFTAGACIILLIAAAVIIFNSKNNYKFDEAAIDGTYDANAPASANPSGNSEDTGALGDKVAKTAGNPADSGVSSDSAAFADSEKTESDEAETDGFRFIINQEIKIDKDTREGSIKLLNHADNDRNERVRIILDDTGEEVYHSRLLSPGEHETRGTFTFENALEAGEYAATAVFELYRIDDGEPAGGIEAAVTLILE